MDSAAEEQRSTFYATIDNPWTASLITAVHTPVLRPIFRTNPRLEAPLPPFFLRTTFRVSAITPASPLIEKSTTLRSSLWCSHCSVAKRQQFSCPLGTATLSLKLENVVPGCWICFFSYCGQVFFLLLFHRLAILLYSHVRVFFKKNLVRCNVFF